MEQKKEYYSISEIADMMGVNASTIRFYESVGLLNNVQRINGRRVFTEEDFSWLRVLNCLRNIGTPIRDIKEYLELAKRGDETLQARYEIILRQKESLEQQIKTLKSNLKELEYKEWYYQTAIKAGTEKIHEGTPCNPSFEPDEIPQKENRENKN